MNVETNKLEALGEQKKQRLLATRGLAYFFNRFCHGKEIFAWPNWRFHAYVTLLEPKNVLSLVLLTPLKPYFRFSSKLPKVSLLIFQLVLDTSFTHSSLTWDKKHWTIILDQIIEALRFAPQLWIVSSNSDQALRRTALPSRFPNRLSHVRNLTSCFLFTRTWTSMEQLQRNTTNTHERQSHRKWLYALLM